MAKRTPIFEEHKRLGANIIDFGGWEMPVYYSSIIIEHLRTRSACGLFDICHMGEIFIEGVDAESLVQKVFSRDISNLEVGKMALGVLCNERGGILDDLTVYKLEEEKFMLVVNSSTTEKDFSWILKAQKGTGFKVIVENKSAFTGKLDIQGPSAQKVLQTGVVDDLNEIKFYNFFQTQIFGVKAIVSRSGYTGEDGFEIYFDWSKGIDVWQKLLEAGKEKRMLPVGLGARDTLRLEAGYNLYGNEMDEKTTPLECRYGWVISLDKNFIGRDAIKRQKEAGAQRVLAGFEMIERGIARHNDLVFFEEEEIGRVTSGTFSPTLKNSIGLCSIKKEFSKPESEFFVQVRDKKLKAKIVKLPFYKRGE